MDASILPRVDDKALEFEINIQDAQFNLEGKYFIAHILFSKFA
jgi:hypothetical protein